MKKTWALIILVAASTIYAGKNTWKNPQQHCHKREQLCSLSHNPFLKKSPQQQAYSTHSCKAPFLPKTELPTTSSSTEFHRREDIAYFNALQKEREYNENILRTICANACSVKSVEQEPSACHICLCTNACANTHRLTLLCALCFGQLDFSCKTNALGK